MKNRLVLSALCCWLAVLIGCTPDRSFKPGTDHPEWAFDRPDYYEPVEEPAPFIKGTNGRPDVYYTAQRVVFIRRPDYPDPREAPRPGVFTTKDHGQTWSKEGHFGLEQTYLDILLPPKDGTYGICVTGVHRPDLAPANLQIQKVYVLDSQAPAVEITVNPEEGPYWVGQRLELTWKVSDPHLGAQPAHLQSRVVDRDGTFVWKDQKSALDAVGTIAVTTEQLPATARGLQFRIKATDQMGNDGAGYTPLLTLMESAPMTIKGGTGPALVRPPRVQPRSKPAARQSLSEPATTTVIIPDSRAKTVGSEQTTSPRTSTGNMPPWSWDERAAAKPSSSPVRAAAPPMPEAKPEPELIATSAGREGQSEPDTEMAELERLLANVSSPIYQGRVQKMPEPGPVVQDVPAIAAAPPAAPEPVATVPQPLVLKPAPEEPMQAPSEEVVVRPIIASPEPAEPVVAVKPPTEPVVLATPEPAPATEPIAMTAPEPEAVVEIPAPSEPSEPMPSVAAVPAETKPTVVVPESKVPATVEPTAGPGPIVTVRPPSQPGMEPEPTEPAPPSATVPLVRSVALSSGKNRMAKPWERLGNRAAAARDFYAYAPTLSNY